MTRDYDRRRLREIYDRNRRRVDNVAKARDRNSSRRGGNDRNDSRDDKKSNAPRRYIVSERTTRRAGFGQGGRQGRTTGARRQNDRDGGRRESRFADKGVTRRSTRDRFERAERNAGVARRGGRRDTARDSGRGARRNNNNNNGGNNRRDGGRNNNDNNGRRFTRGADRKNQRQTDRKKDNKPKDNKPKQNKPLSGDDLNAQLEAYKNNEVFNPSKRAAAPQQQQQQQQSTNSFLSLDAQLEAYRN